MMEDIQYRKEQSLPTYVWVACQCYKASNSVLPFVKVMLTQSSSTPENT